MYNELKSRLAELLAKPRPLKPQAERQIAFFLQEHNLEDTHEFLSKAAGLLQEHELEILFAPQFTPALEDQAAVSEILSRWRPSREETERLAADLCTMNGAAAVQLPDTTEVRLPLHAVMVERFVRLLRLDQAPDPKAPFVAVLQDALPTDLYATAAALMRQRGFTTERQAWYAAFVRHMARRHTVTTGVLSAAAQFIIDQSTFDRAALLAAARELVRAAKSSAEYAQAGRMYWSPDVAQHHQYRGEGKVDEVLVKQRLDELSSLETVADALQSFDGPGHSR